MVRFLISVGLHLLANAIGLLVAAWILPDMSMDGLSLVMAVLIFTVVEVIAQPLLRKIAVKNVEALVGSVALVTTFVGLLVTEIFSDGMDINGLSTWFFATVIVWLAALLAAIILPALLLKKAVEEHRN